MAEDIINLNPFAAINPKKLLNYGLAKRARQAFHVCYGGYYGSIKRGEPLIKHVGFFDWATFGVSTFIELAFEKCREKFKQPDGDLFFIPLAVLAIPYAVSKIARAVLSGLAAVAIFFAAALPFHFIVAPIISCCIDPKAAKKAEKTLGSPAKMQAAVGNGFQGLVDGVKGIASEATAPQDRAHTVDSKAKDLFGRAAHKVKKRAKGAMHKAEKETAKLLDQDKDGYRFG